MLGGEGERIVVGIYKCNKSAFSFVKKQPLWEDEPSEAVNCECGNDLGEDHFAILRLSEVAAAQTIRHSNIGRERGS